MTVYSESSTYETGDPIILKARLRENGSPLLGADMRCWVQYQYQSGYVDSLILFDDGLHQDSLADDGIYANTFMGTEVAGLYRFVFRASGMASVAGSFDRFDVLEVNFHTPSCVAKPGDANASGTYTLADIIAAVNYIFNKPGCTPLPLCWLSGLLCRGDWDGSTTVSLGDVIRCVNYLFNKPGGPWNPVPNGACCIPYNQ